MIGRIEALSIRVALDKTEVLLFHEPHLGQLCSRTGSGPDELSGLDPRRQLVGAASALG